MSTTVRGQANFAPMRLMPAYGALVVFAPKMPKVMGSAWPTRNYRFCRVRDLV
ncbi:MULTISPECIES: hypothetical protein [unclassified Frankia]|uniref:hypothetical protein n=1 Tax=unclassified Frankia TaxID=2632575 RepID=UPI001EF73599|nr:MULTISPECIES: hypothetical protein [unclassified Frankia]